MTYLKNKKLKVYYSQASLGHILYPLFSEKPKRIKSLLELMNEKNIPLVTARKATQEELLEAHNNTYVSEVETISKQNYLTAFIQNTLSPKIQWYTRISKGSYLAALVSAGGVCQAVEDVLKGDAHRAFCMARPPGHHAGVEKGEGFCIFNNVAIGALHALKHGAKKVAIVDFDRHHGNGTEEIVKATNSNSILFISSFQEACKYSHKSEKSETIIPIAIPEHSSFDEVKKLYETHAISALYQFNPNIILLSAGFDMHIDDPLTNIKLESKDFYELTKMFVKASNELCNGAIVSSLEGGYDVKALKECVSFHVDALEEKGL